MQTRKRYEMINFEEIESYINTFQKNGGQFRFPQEYKDLALREDDDPDFPVMFVENGHGKGWLVFYDKGYFESRMGTLMKNYGDIDLVPFAQEEDSTNYSCFYLDNQNNKQIMVINPFWPHKPHIKLVYDDFTAWKERMSN